MAENFRLDPEGLARATSSARDTSRRLGDAFARLTAITDAHDGCWGTDDIGEGFAKNYVGPSAENRKYSKEAVDALAKFATDTDSASTTFQGLDEQNARQVDQQNK